MRLEANDGGFTIDAGDLAQLLRLPPADVRSLMRSGAITTRLERGEDGDAGRFRLTFHHGRNRLRFVVDGDGLVLQVSRIVWPTPPEAEANREVPP